MDNQRDFEYIFNSNAQKIEAKINPCHTLTKHRRPSQPKHSPVYKTAQGGLNLTCCKLTKRSWVEKAMVGSFNLTHLTTLSMTILDNLSQSTFAPLKIQSFLCFQIDHMIANGITSQMILSSSLYLTSNHQSNIFLTVGGATQKDPHHLIQLDHNLQTKQQWRNRWSKDSMQSPQKMQRAKLGSEIIPNLRKRSDVLALWFQIS